MIVRVAARTRYTVIATEALETSTLSWGARGLLAFLLSKPDHWHIDRDHLAEEGPDGVTVVRRLLSELEAAGFLERRRVRTGNKGRFTWETVLYESPSARPPSVENPPLVPTGESAGQTTGGSTTGGKRAVLVNTEEAKTETPKDTSSPAVTDCPDGKPPPTFEDFWEQYPLRVAKGTALRAWNRAVKRADPRVICNAAWRFARDPNRVDKYTPHPASWLNGDRWGDPPLVDRNGNGHRNGHAAIQRPLIPNTDAELDCEVIQP